MCISRLFCCIPAYCTKSHKNTSNHIMSCRTHQPFTDLLTRYHLQHLFYFLKYLVFMRIKAKSPPLATSNFPSSHRHLCLQILPRAFNEAFGHGRHGLWTHLRTVAGPRCWGPFHAVAAGCHEMLVLREAKLQLGFGLSQVVSQVCQDPLFGGGGEEISKRLGHPGFMITHSYNSTYILCFLGGYR